MNLPFQPTNINIIELAVKDGINTYQSVSSYMAEKYKVPNNITIGLINFCITKHILSIENNILRNNRELPTTIDENMVEFLRKELNYVLDAMVNIPSKIDPIKNKSSVRTKTRIKSLQEIIDNIPKADANAQPKFSTNKIEKDRIVKTKKPINTENIVTKPATIDDQLIIARMKNNKTLKTRVFNKCQFIIGPIIAGVAPKYCNEKIPEGCNSPYCIKHYAICYTNRGV